MDRPFASPGAFVTLSMRPAVCDAASLGVADHDASGAIDGGDVVVTVLFEPPNGARNAVVVARDCTALANELARCEAQVDGRAECIEARGPLERELIATLDEDTRTSKVRFRFPDTDSWIDEPNDDHTLAGPATIAITAAGQPLRCGALADRRCADTGGLVACIDELYAIDGTCDTRASNIDSSFGTFTALPPPNDYQTLCDRDREASPCLKTTNELRLTTDVAGNVLVPFDYRGVLVRLDGVPIPRLVRGVTDIPAFVGETDPPRIPGESFLSSYSQEGHRLPPVFSPLADPRADAETTLFGSVDAPLGVIRIARRGEQLGECASGTEIHRPCNSDRDCGGGTCAAATCRGGERAGSSCTADAACPGGACGPALFELRDRYRGDVGPVVIERGAEHHFALQAETPVPIDGLVQTPSVFAFVASEGIDGVDRNDDDDSVDPVVTLRDRRSGRLQAIGQDGADGRAVARVQEPPFSYPAVATQDDVVAFLESEPAEGDADLNGDLDRSDTILRAYRVMGEGAVDLTAGRVLCADAAPVVAGRPIAISGGSLYFRSREASCTRYVTTLEGLQTDGTQPVEDMYNVFRPWQPSDVLPMAIAEHGETVLLATAQAGMAPGKTQEVFFRPELGIPNGFVQWYDVFVRDLRQRITEWASPALVGISQQADRPFFLLTETAANGSLVFFTGTASNLTPDAPIGSDSVCMTTCSDPNEICGGRYGEPYRCRRSNVWVRDRATSSTTWLNPAAPGETPDGSIALAGPPTPDGRFVPLVSRASNLVHDIAVTLGEAHLYVHDRLTGATELLDVSDSGATTSSNPLFARVYLSDDGRYAVFEGAGLELFSDPEQRLAAEGNPNIRKQIFRRDRLLRKTEVASLTSDDQIVGAEGCEGQPNVNIVGMSRDGRFVTFASSACSVVPGDQNGIFDVFVRDLVRGTTQRLSLGSDSLQATGSRTGRATRDGRFTLLSSDRALVREDTNGADDFYLHDRVTGITDRVSLTADGGQLYNLSLNASQSSAIDGDGVTIAFSTSSPNVLGAGTDANLGVDTYVRTADPGDVANDYNDDGDHRDIVARVVDLATGEVVDLAPAVEVAVAQEAAALRVPESEVGAGTDLNSDGDTDDTVVHLVHGAVENLHVAASQLALGEDWLVGAVDESAQGGIDQNSDDDETDSLLWVYSPTSGSWKPTPYTSVGPISISGDIVAFRTREADESEDLNGDGDEDDFVIRAYDAANDELVWTGPAAEEFVLQGSLLAFRTSEEAQGGRSLNPPDEDSDDAVLQIYDLARRELLNTGQAAIPCELEACDPRVPYRVEAAAVTFLTLECQQGGGERTGCAGGGSDLDGDGDAADLVLQVVRIESSFARTSAMQRAAAPPDPSIVTLAAVRSGICTNGVSSCASDSDCGSDGRCFVPPGGCIVDLRSACNPLVPDACGAGRFCQPVVGAALGGTCHQRVGPCSGGGDDRCAPPAECVDEAQTIQRLGPPIGSAPGTTDIGVHVFASAGTCVESRGVPCDDAGECEPGDFCDAGSCSREHGTCATDQDCPVPTTGACRKDLVTSTAADRDADGLADPLDDCPDSANPDQVDADGDGVGDACDRRPRCGDGFVDVADAEHCDDANLTSGDGCSAECRLEVPACSNGFDDDADGFIDLEDPGCAFEEAPSETPPCDDGIDNDHDGHVDFADPWCSPGWPYWEAPPCGLGAELVSILSIIEWRRRRAPSRRLVRPRRDRV